jgi:hypothetical protein
VIERNDITNEEFAHRVYALAEVKDHGPGATVSVGPATMNRLRRIILLLSVTLAAVIARMVIDDPKVIGGLTGALLLVLLLCSLRLRQHGRRLHLRATPETERFDAR